MIKSLIATAALLGCTTLAHCAPLPAYPFVKTVGKADVWLAPNLGELRFEINAQNDSSEKALERMAQLSAEVQALLAEHAVAGADIEAFDLSKKPVELSNVKAGQFSLAYTLKRHFRVFVRDLAQWPELVKALLARDTVETLTVGFDRNDRAQVERKLVLEAAASARGQGFDLALAFGRHLGAVEAISQAGVDKIGAPFGFDSAASGEARADAAPPPPGALSFAVPPAIQFAQAVHAVFRLK